MYRCLLLILLLSNSCLANTAIQFVFTHEGKRFEKIIDDFSHAEGIPVERLWTEQGDLRVKLVEYVNKEIKKIHNRYNCVVPHILDIRH